MVAQLIDATRILNEVPVVAHDQDFDELEFTSLPEAPIALSWQSPDYQVSGSQTDECYLSLILETDAQHRTFRPSRVNGIITIR